MKKILSYVMLAAVTWIAAMPVYGAAPVSDATQECLDCHATFHPGIVADWRASRHAQMTVQEAIIVEDVARKVSATDIPAPLLNVAVGCAECHTLRNEKHADAFEHNGADIHVVVSPDDCATCHADERQQYSKNLMAHAHSNLVDNDLYRDLQRNISGPAEVKDGALVFGTPSTATQEDSCLYCHGTRLAVTGREIRDTDAGELAFPVISGWPNQGVGRVNLDGSLGSCSACHTRHGFSIEVARKPHTCKECHVGPDVPAVKVYEASKHGNIFSSLNQDWDFKTVPWVVGKHFTAPTCAACHVSLLTNTDGLVVAQRTHQMTDRLADRLFGLVYAHPQPKSPETQIIRSPSGLSLPTDLDGTPASAFLIDTDEQGRRRDVIKGVCVSCHDRSWVRGHFERLDHVIGETNATVKVATGIISKAWTDGIVSGPPQKKSPFDEALERTWMDGWLFYANTVRFSAAMGGGGDYSTFADGRYQLTRSLLQLHQGYQQGMAAIKK
ncbi:MAG: multiheme c-type cytochrome [Pseudomonadota bacterium]